jgi:hypothetical protein
MKTQACAACPWIQKHPDKDVQAMKKQALPSLKAGQWFCCHVNLGTCHGAAEAQKRMNK